MPARANPGDYRESAFPLACRDLIFRMQRQVLAWQARRPRWEGIQLIQQIQFGLIRRLGSNRNGAAEQQQSRSKE